MLLGDLVDALTENIMNYCRTHLNLLMTISVTHNECILSSETLSNPTTTTFDRRNGHNEDT
jgi:hypothetical protein